LLRVVTRGEPTSDFPNVDVAATDIILSI
jgi:hypothetical protein